MVFNQHTNGLGKRILTAVMGKIPKKLKSFAQVEKIAEQRSEDFTDNVDKHLKFNNPFLDWLDKLDYFEGKMNAPIDMNTLEQSTEQFSAFENFAQIPSTQSYWQQEIDTIKKLQQAEQEQAKKSKKGKKTTKSAKSKKSAPKETSEQKLQQLYKQQMQQWRKYFDEEHEKWQSAEMEKLQSQFMHDMDEWISCLSKMQQSVEDMGMNLEYFIGLADGEISLSDIETLKKWLEIIQGDTGIQEICDILGRMRQANHSMEMQRIETSDIVTKYVPDYNSSEEISGVEISNDIERVIPSELSLLSSPETAILFDLKLVESQLMCFQMMGQQMQDETIKTTEEKSVKVEDPKGPVILCIDTSGSMHGSPEYVAKAITLYMVNMARQDDRNCYLINFSTGIETLDFSAGVPFSKIVDFLRQSFHGGTDITPALHHAVEQMQGDTYANADCITISDFVMGGLPSDLKGKMNALRENGNKFHSLCITGGGVSDHLKTDFDQEWVYDPHTSKVSEIVKITNKITKTA